MTRNMYGDEYEGLGKPATITQQPQPHWRNKEWEYIPSTDHIDASKFKERMEKRRKEAQEPQPPTTETQ